MKKILDEKIKEIVSEYGTAEKASIHFLTETLRKCPFERMYILPGKLYAFRYFQQTKKKAYDTFPFIMALGPDKTNAKMFYGIDMHHIPYDMRLQIFGFIYEKFEREIRKNIEKYTELKDSPKQDCIKEISTQLISESPFNIDISPSIHRYNMKYVSDCRVINYKMLPFMLLSDDDYFANGSIRQAQEEFMEKCGNRK